MKGKRILESNQAKFFLLVHLGREEELNSWATLQLEKNNHLESLDI